MIDTTKQGAMNGRAPIAMVITGCFGTTECKTKRLKPNGGEIIAIASTLKYQTPNQTGLIPRSRRTGITKGIVSSKGERSSTNIPPIK
jgi:hypothetical protein